MKDVQSIKQINQILNSEDSLKITATVIVLILACLSKDKKYTKA